MFLIVLVLIFVGVILYSKYKEIQDREDNITSKSKRNDYELIKERYNQEFGI